MTDPHSIKSIVLDNFKNRFKEPRHDEPMFDNPLFKKLEETEASFLEYDVMMEEIKAAVWSYSGSKAPGPNGLNFKFIKCYWDILQHDFFNCVSHFLQTGRLAKGCNASFISLAPNVVILLIFLTSGQLV